MPITLAGRICGLVLTFLGVGVVAIPTGILSAGFMEQVSIAREKAVEEGILDEGELEEETEDYSYCPYCGKKLPEK